MAIPPIVVKAGLAIGVALLPKLIGAATNLGSRAIDGAEAKAGEVIDKVTAPKTAVDTAEIVKQNTQMAVEMDAMKETLKQLTVGEHELSGAKPSFVENHINKAAGKSAAITH
jgi:folate-dependent phosphoribosylglycinamide formyltransferase PurN